MKESGIEKLVELLNEYDSSNGWKETEEGIDNIWKIYEFHSELQIISKKYGFIKWLVENDKINKDLISRVLIRAYISPKNLVSLECEFHDYYESLLMLLSISSSPIEDLLLYLK